MNTKKVRGRILTVDPSQRLIEAGLKDTGSITVAMWEIPPSFQWPQVGENWTLYREQGYWHLGKRLEGGKDPNTDFRVEDMAPGHMKLGADTVFADDGNQIPAYPPSSAPVNGLLTKTDTGWKVEQASESTIATSAKPKTGIQTPSNDMIGITQEVDVDGCSVDVDTLDGQTVLVWVNAQVNPGDDAGPNELSVYLNVADANQDFVLKGANNLATGASSWEFNVSGAYRLMDLVGPTTLKLRTAQTAGSSVTNALRQTGTQLLYMVLWE